MGLYMAKLFVPKGIQRLILKEHVLHRINSQFDSWNEVTRTESKVTDNLERDENHIRVDFSLNERK